MTTRLLIITVILLTKSISFAQVDTIFSNNEKILCIVKEVTPDAIKYVYPGEDIITTIYKNAVQKVVYKSGRVQTFAESSSFKKVEKVADFDNVTITQVESEIRGLFKIGDVSSKSKGATTLSNQERVKERAFRKLKIQAAMQGANIIYLTNMRTDGNKMGTQYQAGSSAETNLTGVAYTNQIVSYSDFVKLIGEKKKFIVVQTIKLYSSSSDIAISDIQSTFIINKIINENGLIKIEGELGGVTKYFNFRVVSFTNEFFNIYYEDKSSIYNIKIEI